MQSMKLSLFELLANLSLFGLFQCYWHTVQRRGRELNSLAVFIMNSHIFDYLRKEWVAKRGYSLDLKYIISGMDVLYDEFDPRLFVNNSNLFIKKLVEFEKKLEMARHKIIQK